MKNKLIKGLLGILFLFGFYYIVSIAISRNGQFVQHYYHPSVTIEESKEFNIFLYVLTSDSFEIIGSLDFRNFIDSELVIWVDNLKVQKSFGIFNLAAYSTIKHESKVVRIAYRDGNKRYSGIENNSIWIDYNNKLTKNISTTTGYGYKKDSIPILKFYKDKKKTILFGTIKINPDVLDMPSK